MKIKIISILMLLLVFLVCNTSSFAGFIQGTTRNIEQGSCYKLVPCTHNPTHGIWHRIHSKCKHLEDENVNIKESIAIERIKEIQRTLKTINKKEY